MRPGFSGVDGFVNAITDGKIGSREAFAARHINDIGIRRRDRNGADRLSRLRIKDWRPGAPVIGGFPHAAIDSADVEHIRLARYAGQSAGASATVWPDHPPTQFLIRGFRKLL